MTTEHKKSISICDFISKTAIYLLVFLIPIFFLPWTTDFLGFNKQTVLIFLVFISTLACLLKSVVSGKIAIPLNVLHIPAVVILLGYGASTLFSLWKYESLWGWPGITSESFITVLCLFFLYFLVVSLFKKRDFLYLSLAFVFSGIIAVIFGIFQIFGMFLLPFEFTRSVVFNTIGSINSLGIFAAILLPLIIFLAIEVKKSLKIALLLSLIPLALLFIVINFSVVWYLVILGSFCVIVFGTQRRNFFDSRFIIIPMFFLAISFFFLFFRLQVIRIERPLEVYLNQRGSFNIAREAIKENPILGSGPGTFLYNFLKYKDSSMNDGIFWNTRFENSGSKTMTVSSTTGIFGTLSFLFLMITSLFVGFKFLLKGKKDEEEKPDLVFSPGLIISLLVLSVGYFLYFSNITIDFLFFFLISGIGLISTRERKEIFLRPSSLPSLFMSFAATLIFLLGLGIFIIQGQRYASEVEYLRSFKAFSEDRIENGIEHLEKAAEMNLNNDLLFRELSQAYLGQINIELQREDLGEEELSRRVSLLIDFSISSAVRATEINPKKISNWSVRAFIYQNLIEINEEIGSLAIRSYEEAEALEPINPYFPTQKGRVYFRKATLLPSDREQEMTGLFRQAEEEFRKAINLKSDYSPARFQLAMIYQVQGRADEAIKELAEARRVSPQDIGLMFQLGVLYYQNDQYDKARTELERSLSIDPNYANALYFLGLVYDKQDKREKAIEQFEKVAKNNPGNEEVKKILNNLKGGKKALDGIIQDTLPRTPIEETLPEMMEDISSDRREGVLPEIIE